MEVILSIVFVIASVLVYDYYAARKWLQETSGVRNEVVFANRNQKYGAYVLRRDYDKNMVYIMLGLILSMGLIFGSYLFFKENPIQAIIPPAVADPQIEILLNFDPVIPEVKKQQQTEPATKKMIANIAPIIVDKPVVQKPIIQEIIAEIKQPGGTGNNGFGAGIGGGGGGGENPVKPEMPKDVVEAAADIDAEYIGGKAAMYGFIQSRLIYPQGPASEGIEGKCYLKFIVNADGKVSNVTVERGVPDCPECDKEAVRVIKAMPNWKPAILNGKPVRTWFQIPFNFKLQ